MATSEPTTAVRSDTPSKTDQGDGRLPKSFDDLDHKRRGVKPGARRGRYDKGNERPAGSSTQPVAASGTVFTPESLRPLVCLPYDLAFVKTGWTGFPLTDNEASTLSHTGAMVANEWLQVDPKWVALITFSLSLASITAAKIVGYKKALVEFTAQQEAAKKAAEEKATPVTAVPA